MENVIVKSVDEIKIQLYDFQKVYPDMRIIKESETEMRLGGNFTLHKEYGNYQAFQDYTIEIVIPIASSQLPYVIDVGRHINPMYHHYYADGKLCLETDVNILAEFTAGFDLLHWMDKYVESYFFTYEYYMRFGEFPYGERSHGLDGILESYKDIFGTKNAQETYDIMQHINNNRYRGHHLCPCQSGKKIRDCHGEKMIPFYNNKNLNQILKSNYNSIKEAIRKREGNTKKAK